MDLFDRLFFTALGMAEVATFFLGFGSIC